MLDLCLTNCRLELNDKKLSLGIKDGKLFSIKSLPSKAHETLNLDGKLVLPGLIDTHVHLRDPGMTNKEDFRTGTAAAAAGGFTTVLDMPNNDPPTSTPAAFVEKFKIGKKKSLVDFGLHAGVTDPDHIEPLSELRPASFKIFMDLVDTTFLRDASMKIKGCNLEVPLSLHPEDQEIIARCTRSMKEKGSQPYLYSQARPPLAEEVAVKKALILSQNMNQKIHLCHISTKKSLKMIKDAQKSGMSVTFEITPHHLFLDASYFKKFGTLAKTNPPLRDADHKLTMNELVNIDMVATDHAPHTTSEKNQNIWTAPPGVPGLETALPLLLTELNKGNVELDDLKRLLCENPARIFNIPNKGFIKEGIDADLVVV
ncbi:MAG TPA: dihydroorotase, partial [Methanobacteriaceae archaeon]|nr:dihydroorotase [Methanobacteriaceae archaeon]